MTTQSQQHYSAVGKRKTAVARVKLFENGTGQVRVNDLSVREYFPGLLSEIALSPLLLTEHLHSFDVDASVGGGGGHSQSEAVRHGISKALLLFNPELRLVLKKAGFLRRDSRIRERKKPGLKRARRAPQWQKR